MGCRVDFSLHRSRCYVECWSDDGSTIHRLFLQELCRVLTFESSVRCSCSLLALLILHSVDVELLLNLNDPRNARGDGFRGLGIGKSEDRTPEVDDALAHRRIDW